MQKGEASMRAIYKKIGVTIIVLLLGVGSAFLWQSSKQTKQEKRSATQVKLTALNKEPSDPLTPDELKRIKASLDEYLRDVVPTSDRQVTLPNGETVYVDEYLRDVDNLLQMSKAERAETKKYLTGLNKLIGAQRKQMSKETDDLKARINKLDQQKKVLDENWALMKPVVDSLYAFFGEEPNVIPEPPADASFEEQMAFYEDLQKKMEQDPNYLRSIQPQIMGRSASQTPKTGFIHTLLRNDKQNLDTDHFRTNAHSQITSLRDTLEQQYFDVLMTPHLTPEKFDKIFPTEKEREILQIRKSEMTQHVVKNIQRFLSDKPNNQKISIVRELLTQNFDKDFAETVLTELQKDVE